MSIFKKILQQKKILVTHNGSFHADDLFACATMSLWFQKNNQSFNIIRTRDKELIKKADYVFDVGGVYDEASNKFDHHQREGAGTRPNGIPYASFGLAWKHFGMELCSNNEEVWNIIDTNIASSLDAIDNGVDIVVPKFKGVFPYSGSQSFLIYSPTWKEDESQMDNLFIEQVKKATVLLAREIKVALDNVEGKNMIMKSYQDSKDKRIVELETSFPRYLFQSILSELPEPIYVIYPSSSKKNWKVEAISKSGDTLESRKLFPESWRGIMEGDNHLKEVTGVPDVLFSHRTGFYMTVSSKEGALALAEKALLA